jgi:hypothetical protein
MSTGRKPIASEVLEVVDRLERGKDTRVQLATSYGLFISCVGEGLLSTESIDWWAQCMQQLVAEGLIAHGPASLGAPDEPSIWSGGWIQQVHDWRVTASGQAAAALYRDETVRLAQSGASEVSNDNLSATDTRDVFISHASEDKDAVARPLRQALASRGWRVWLDELELTIGDSLSGRIDAALAQTRFGVVVLSPAFFDKPWPQRELQGLAAREVAGGSKVILPVWHDVDQDFIVKRSPTLADRLGVPTARGIEHVADEICRALKQTEAQSEIGWKQSEQDVACSFGVPMTAEETAALLIARPDYWEYFHFAGVLNQGLSSLELKLHDHEFRLPGGRRLHLDDVSDAQIGWVTTQIEGLMRLFEPTAYEQAFGVPGEPGDPVRIEHFARRILSTLEALVDWAAELRNASVQEPFEESVAILACMVDQPIIEIRGFIQTVVSDVARIPELLAEDNDEPVILNWNLSVTADDKVFSDFDKALRRARKRR